MTGKGYPSFQGRLWRWLGAAMLLAAGWTAGPARAQTLPASGTGPTQTTSTVVSPYAGTAGETAPNKLPASVRQDKPTPGSEVKTDENVVQVGCASCGGGLLGGLGGLSGHGGPPSYEGGGGGCSSCGGGGGCASGCVPGRLHCCSECCGDTPVGRVLCGLYNCICCPDPCYEPHWVAAANASFFTDAARPVTQTMLRYDGQFAVLHPDRNEFLIPRSGASNGINMLPPIPCAKMGFGKGPKYVARTADIEDLIMHTEGAVEKGSIFIDMSYREFGPNGSLSNNILGTENNVCNSSGFGDMVIGTKSLLLDCELLQIAFQFKTFLPTGNFLQNLGTGHVSLEPSLLFALKLTPDTYLQAQAAYWIPIAGDPLYEGDVFHAHASLNQVLYRILPDVQLIGTLETNVWGTNGGNFTSEKIGAVIPDPTGLIPLSRRMPFALPEGGSVFMFSAGPGIRLNICDKIDFGVGSAFAFTGPRWAQEEVRAEFRWRF